MTFRQERWFEVRSPGHVYYYKGETDVADGRAPLGVIDLRLVVALKFHATDAGTRDGTRVDLELADRRFKLRAPTSDDASAWLDALQHWRDYAVEHDEYHPHTHFQEGDAASSNSASNRTGDTTASASSASSSIGGTDAVPSLSPLGDDDTAAAADADSATPGTAATTLSPMASIRLSSQAPSACAAISDSSRSGRASGAAGVSSSMTRRPSAPRANSGVEAAGGDDGPMPAPLEGILEKKKARAAWRDTWHERYFRIDPSDATLKYYKCTDHGTPPGAGAVPKGVIDMRMVDVEPYSKTDDPLRFSLNLGQGDGQVKLRAKSADDTAKWLRGLDEWKEHFLLTCSSFEASFDDIDAAHNANSSHA